MHTVFKAILELSFHLTMAIEKMKPPIKTIVVSVNIEAAISEAVETVKIGMRKTGKNAVITIGIGSKIQYAAVIIVTPKQGLASGLSLST